jgi:FtsP/CotA-like multicopper oxidase with cupredoxin domain
LATTALAACIAVGAPFMASGNAGSPHKSGIVCTKSPTATFDLTARDGQVQLPDGNTAYMWGYSTGYDHATGLVKPGDAGEFQHPGPVLCVTEGDTVTVVLHNSLKYDDVSVVFPGQKNVLANGAPVKPQTTAGTVTSLAQVAIKDGGTVTYTFTADHAGTFLYESGTNPQVQVKMGLFGALIVRPAGNPDQVYDRADSRFNPNSEYMVLLSEIDPYLNGRMEQIKAKKDAGQTPPAAFNLASYHPRYWLINGRGFPDSIADNFAEWLPSQPYGSLAEIQPKGPGNPYPSVDRYLSVGSEDYPFHPHGNNAKIIGRDGRPVVTPTGADLSFDKFSIPAGPGQTWDALFDWTNEENYTPATLPTTDPQLQNLVVGTFYSGTPYLGTQGPLPPGSATQNECGEYYIIAHNHALYQITSWGVNMTGPITYTRVNPPTGTCS